MPKVIVVAAEKGKYKVLVNYIQQGSEYSCEAMAEAQAILIRKQIAHIYNR